MSKIFQIRKEDWCEVADPQYIATLPFSHDKLEKIIGFKFFVYDEVNLGKTFGVYAQIEDVQYLFTAQPDELEEQSELVSVQIPSIQNDSLIALNKLLKVLNIEMANLVWKNESLGPCRWVLYRLDDNNNRFEVKRFLNDQSADWVKRKYEQKGHKQIYEVQKLV